LSLLVACVGGGGGGWGIGLPPVDVLGGSVTWGGCLTSIVDG